MIVGLLPLMVEYRRFRSFTPRIILYWSVIHAKTRTWETPQIKRILSYILPCCGVFVFQQVQNELKHTPQQENYPVYNPLTSPQPTATIPFLSRISRRRDKSPT